MGDIRTLEIPLPTDATGEVVLDMTTRTNYLECGYYAFPPTAGYLIDDLPWSEREGAAGLRGNSS